LASPVFCLRTSTGSIRLFDLSRHTGDRRRDPGRLSSLPGAFIGGMVAGMIEALLVAVPDVANLRSAGPYVAALIFLMIVGAGQGVGARE
jgi:hypothetical protein